MELSKVLQFAVLIFFVASLIYFIYRAVKELKSPVENGKNVELTEKDLEFTYSPQFYPAEKIRCENINKRLITVEGECAPASYRNNAIEQREPKSCESINSNLKSSSFGMCIPKEAKIAVFPYLNARDSRPENEKKEAHLAFCEEIFGKGECIDVPEYKFVRPACLEGTSKAKGDCIPNIGQYERIGDDSLSEFSYAEIPSEWASAVDMVKPMKYSACRKSFNCTDNPKANAYVGECAAGFKRYKHLCIPDNGTTPMPFVDRLHCQWGLKEHNKKCYKECSPGYFQENDNCKADISLVDLVRYNCKTGDDFSSGDNKTGGNCATGCSNTEQFEKIRIKYPNIQKIVQKSPNACQIIFR